MSARTDAAVSEVLGSVMLVAVSVVVLAGFGAIVLSNVTSEGNEPPSASFSMAPSGGDAFVDVSFVSGEPFRLDGAHVVLQVNGVPTTGASSIVSTATDGRFHPGDTLHVVLSSGALAPADELYLLVVHTESGKPIGTAYATIPDASTLPAYVFNAPLVASASLSPAPLVADGSSLANLSARVSSSRGLALVASVTADLTPIGGRANTPLLDDGEGGDLVAGDGNYTVTTTASNHTFLSSHLTEDVDVVVTVRDVLGHEATATVALPLSPTQPPKILTGTSYGPIPSSPQLGWLNLTGFSFKSTSALGDDEAVVRVYDTQTSGVAWEATVSFTGSCGGSPGVLQVAMTIDGAAGVAHWTPAGGCFPLDADAQLDLAFLNQSVDKNGASPLWTTDSGSHDYQDAAISSANRVAITFFGDTVSLSPSATGLGQTDVNWGPLSGNLPPVASFVITLAPHTPPYMDLEVDAGASSDPDGSIASYVWSWGDGTADGSGATPTHTYATPGVYTVNLTVSDGASTSTQQRFAVADHAPTASFTATVTNLSVDFDASASSDVDAGHNLTYEWEWGDGSPDGSGATPTHVYPTGGSYTANLTVRDPYGVAGSDSHVVAPNRAPDFDTISTSSSNRVAFVNVTASDPDGNAIGYAINWGEGNVSASGNGPSAAFEHTYAANGIYTASLYVNDTAGASNSTTRQITITQNAAPVISAFTAEASGLVGFVNASASDPDANAIGYVVVWGDGSTSTAGDLASVSLSHSYSAAGAYTVTIYVNDTLSGSSSQSTTVTANRAPVISSATSAASLLVGYLNASASDPDGQAITYEIAWGDGGTGSAGDGATASLQHTYASAGTYTATLYVNDTLGGSASVTRAIVVRTNAVPVISAFIAQVNNLVAFVNASASDADPDTIAYAVAWGDGQTDTAGNVASIALSHTYAAAGDYVVTIFVNDTWSAATPQSSNLQANRAPVISSFTTQGALLVGFANVSASDPDGQAITYEVAWGDGQTSVAGNGATANLQHAYASAGTYTVTVFVNDTLGGSTSATGSITAAGNNAPVIGSFTRQGSGLVGFVNATASDPNSDAITYAVAWGDGQTTTAGNVASIAHSHAYAAAGSYTVTIFVNDSWGASTSQSGSLVANRAPTISSLTNVTSDLNATMTISASDADGQTLTTTYAWGDGTSSTTNTHQYALPGNYTVTAYVNDTLGGSASTTNRVTVTQTLYVGATDTSFATPGGSYGSIANLARDNSGDVATLVEDNTGSTVTAITGCDTTFTQPACSLSGLTWKINSSSTGAPVLSVQASEGTPTADGALQVSPANNGARTNILNYYFNQSGAAGTTLTTLTLDWKMTLNGGVGQVRTVTGHLVAPNGTSVVIGTFSTSADTGWGRFTATNVSDNFLTQAGQYLLRVTFNSEKNGDTLNLDNVFLNWTASNNYRAQKQLSIAPAPSGAGFNHYLQVRANQTSANAEGLQVQVWNGASWTTRATISSTTMTTHVIALAAADVPSGNQTIQVRLVDATTSSDNAQSAWQIDYIRDVVWGP